SHTSHTSHTAPCSLLPAPCSLKSPDAVPNPIENCYKNHDSKCDREAWPTANRTQPNNSSP
ncbi:MAG: hypothetical protein F6K26_52370, partial [Moorea sp. SIO2I5]|nr:hypothetical protein [Moorena sp. SIO2I5]